MNSWFGITEPQVNQFKADFLRKSNTSWTVRLERLVRNCLNIIKPRKLIMLCDEFDTIEPLFNQKILSVNALLWIKVLLNLQAVHFVMTSSHEFEESTVRTVLNPVAQMYPIHELSMSDALALIQNPIGEQLTYKEGVPEIIYLLSGGHPFYVQYICHTLVNHVNAEIRRNYVVAEDLDGVIDFIVRNPAGHIQETWKSLSNPNYAPKYGRETLAALANTIKHSKEYVSTSRIFKTVRKKRFEVVDKQALYKTLAWFIQNTRLLERKSENYRFRTDLIRHWISYEFQTGEEIEPLVVPTLTQESPKKEEAGQLLGHPSEEKQELLHDSRPLSVGQKLKYRWFAAIGMGILIIGVALFLLLKQTPELRECEKHFQANNLTIGKGGNALVCYKNVLKKDSTNAEALAGLRKIEARLVTLTTQALDKEQQNQAQQYLASLSMVNPESPMLAELTRQLEKLELAQQLRECDRHFQANRLTIGKGGNALVCYKNVLKKDSTNAEALAGLRKIEARLIGLTTQALDKGQQNQTQQYLASLSMVNPESPMLAELTSQLEKLELAQQLRECDRHFQANRLTIGKSGNALVCYKNVLKKDSTNAEALAGLRKIEERLIELTIEALNNKQLNEAEQYLASLNMVNPESPMLAKLTRQLEKLELAQQLRECDRHFQANRLTIGKGGNALVCYKNVLKKDSTNAEALAGLRKIEERLIELTIEALNNKQLNEAEQYLASLRKVNPNSRKIAFFEKLLSSRYTDNGNGTVTDNKTGLIWLKKSNCFSRKTWTEAMQSAAKLAHGQCGLRDGSRRGKWRLPTLREWKAMLDKRYKNPALSNTAGTGKWKEGDAFVGVQSNSHWSSTQSEQSSNIRDNSKTWVVYVLDGRADHKSKIYHRSVWPVRDSQR